MRKLYICPLCKNVHADMVYVNTKNTCMSCKSCNDKLYGMFQIGEGVPDSYAIEISRYNDECCINDNVDEAMLVCNDNAKFKQSMNPTYVSLHFIYRVVFNKKHTDKLSDSTGNFKTLYNAFKEDRDNFILTIDEGVDWDDEHSVALLIFNSLKNSKKSKSATVKALRSKYLNVIHKAKK